MPGASLPAALRDYRLAVRRATGRSLAGLRTAGYLRKWVLLGIAIGIVAGLGAVVFITALHLATHYVLAALGGYTPATTAGEGGVRAAIGTSRPWALPLVVGLGGLLSGIVVVAFAPEAEGHGTDAAISAVHNHPKGVRPRVALVKIVASALMIGSGGSGGREGPTAQISSSFGSLLARTLNLTPSDARLAVGSGMASGIAAIFRAPLGGALLGVELLYRDDIEAAALVPSLVASIVAFVVYGSIEGFSPIFGYHTGQHFTSPSGLVWFVLLGLVAGGFGRLYAATFHRMGGRWGRAGLPSWLKPALGGLCTGAIGIALPGVLGTGYGTIQQSLERGALLTSPLWLVLALPFAKVLATSFSIGSGGSGGIFGPGVVIGGLAGAALWRLLESAAPGVSASPVPFVIVGMAACFGSIAHAPLAVMLMVAEMTGNLGMLAPAIVAVAVASLVAGDATLYTSQPRNRAESPAHRFVFGLPAMSSVPVTAVMTHPRLLFRDDESATVAAAALGRSHLPGAPVVTSRGTFVGSLQAPRLLAARPPEGPVGRLADPQAMILPTDAALDAAAEAIGASNGGWVPVLDADMRVAGIVAGPDLVRGYRIALDRSLRLVSRTSPSSRLVDITVAPDSRAAGRRIADLGLPPRTVILTVHRGDALLFAGGETVLEDSDELSIVGPERDEAAMLAIFGAEPHGLGDPEPTGSEEKIPRAQAGETGTLGHMDESAPVRDRELDRGVLGDHGWQHEDLSWTADSVTNRDGALLPVRATAQRPDWTELPEPVRDRIEERTGSRVVATASSGTGFTPGFASRLDLADGRRLFVKAASSAYDREHGWALTGAYREEARKLRLLPDGIGAPPLLWAVDEPLAGEQWVVTGFAYVDGRPPRRPWRRNELTLVLDKLAAIAPSLAGHAELGFETFYQHFADWYSWRDAVAARDGESDWLDTVSVLVEESVTRCAGTSVAHLDLRDDNVLLTPDGEVFICDWNWPMLAAPWVDLVCLLCSARGDGHDTDAILRSHPLSRDVESRSIDALLANLWLYFAMARLKEVPAGSPYLRIHQTWYAGVTHDWLADRLRRAP